MSSSGVWILAGLSAVLAAPANCRPQRAHNPSLARIDARRRTSSRPVARPPQTPARSKPCLLYGPGYSFLLTEPRGWRMFCGDQAPPDKLAVLVHQREPPSQSKPWGVMYVVTLSKPADVAPAAFLRALVARKKRQLAGLSVARKTALHTGDRRDAQVRVWEVPRQQLFEVSAYLFHKEVVVVLALYARDRALLKRYRKDFEAFVRSYRFLSGNVKAGQTR